MPRAAARDLFERALLTGAMIWPLVLAGAAFGQTQQLGLTETTPVDEDAGIRVPEGFDAKIFAEGVGRARHIAVRDNGDVYVALRQPNEGHGVVALRDDDGDGAPTRSSISASTPGLASESTRGFFTPRATMPSIAMHCPRASSCRRAHRRP
jgi:hypothetical protein